MGHSLRNDLHDLPRKSAAKAHLRGETDRKPFADLRIGPVIERAISLSGLTKQQAASEMGYEDSSALARWISGTENPQLIRLWSARVLRAGLVIALAEDAEVAVEVETVVRVKRRSA